MWASADPTRPHPMITMCMIILPAATVPEERYALLSRGASAGVLTRQCRSGPEGGTMVGVRHEKTGPYAAGDVLDVIVGEPVHGGWCVARPGAPEAAAQPGGPGNPGQAGRGPVAVIPPPPPRGAVQGGLTH